MVEPFCSLMLALNLTAVLSDLARREHTVRAWSKREYLWTYCDRH